MHGYGGLLESTLIRFVSKTICTFGFPQLICLVVSTFPPGLQWYALASLGLYHPVLDADKYVSHVHRGNKRGKKPGLVKVLIFI